MSQRGLDIQAWIEPMETRRHLSVSTSGNSVVVQSTQKDDYIVISLDTTQQVLHIWENNTRYDFMAASVAAIYAYGGNGDDTIGVNQANGPIFASLILSGGNGNDILVGGSGQDIIWGGNGNDQIFGQNSNDWLFGNNGADVIYGGNGDDRIDGGNGMDWLFGQAGLDRFGEDEIRRNEIRDLQSSESPFLNDSPRDGWIGDDDDGDKDEDEGRGRGRGGGRSK